jgi:Plasmid pRiA4b ORF-3-like protein
MPSFCRTAHNPLASATSLAQKAWIGALRQEMRIMAKPAARKSHAGETPLSLKVTLRDTKPPIWRRLVIPGEMTLGDLHQAI